MQFPSFLKIPKQLAYNLRLKSSPLRISVKLIFLQLTLYIHQSHTACSFITYRDVSCTIVFAVSPSNTQTFPVLCYPKKISILSYLMVFKLKRRPINISCCCLASENMSQPLRFALRRLTTSAAPFLPSFNI